MVELEPGGTVLAEAAIDGVNETIVGVTNTVLVFVAGWFPGGELAVEEDHIDYIFIDLRGREFRGLQCKCVPPRLVFRHTWKDIINSSFSTRITT